MPKTALLPLLLLTAACGSGNVMQAAGSRNEASVEASRSDLPRLSGRVVDGADILPASAEAALAKTLEGLESRTRDQLVVVTTADLKGEPIEAFGRRLGDGWGIGQRDLDNGVLLIVAPKDRRTRIEVGRGLEGLLTDARAKDIIETALLPHFREGDYADGVEAGVGRIAALLDGDARRPQRRTRQGEQG